MANHKSALKRARQSEEKRIRNKSNRTRVKNVVKEVRTAVAGNSSEKIGESFKEAVSTIQRVATKGVIHKNTANRKVSRLARLINQSQKS